MNTQTIPGKSKTTRVAREPARGNTIGTGTMSFDQVAGLLSERPIRCPVHTRIDDLDLVDDINAAQAVLSESEDLLPYAEVRKELGLGD
jgi:hypothetical protein